jgi:PAS domain S-box-containing protein
MDAEIRVLILEDTASDAELAEYALKKAGIAFVSKRVERRDTFAAALDEFRPDIVLSDYKLPGFSGMAALKLAQQLHPEIPVIIVTGALSDIEAVELIKAGAKDYVLKDRLARLAPAVQGALAAEQGARARKAAEKALAESEETFRDLATQSALGLAIIGKEGFAYVNPRFAEIFGYTVDEIKKLQPYNLVMEDDRRFWQETVRRCIAGEIKRANDTFKGVRKDGSLIDIETYATGSELGGKPVALASVLDITERKSAENALRESEEKFHSIFDAMPHGIIMQLASGKIYAANVRAEKMTGIRAGQMVGLTLATLPWHIIHPGGTPFGEGEFPADISLRTGQSCGSVVMGVKHPDGELVWISATAEPLFRKGERKPYAAVTTLNKISAPKEAQQNASVAANREPDQAAQWHQAKGSMRN